MAFARECGFFLMRGRGFQNERVVVSPEYTRIPVLDVLRMSYVVSDFYIN